MDDAIGSCCMRMILMCLFKDLLRKSLPLCSFYSEKLFLLDLNSAIWVFPSLGLMGLVGLVKKKKTTYSSNLCCEQFSPFVISVCFLLGWPFKELGLGNFGILTDDCCNILILAFYHKPHSEWYSQVFDKKKIILSPTTYH